MSFLLRRKRSFNLWLDLKFLIFVYFSSICRILLHFFSFLTQNCRQTPIIWSPLKWSIYCIISLFWGFWLFMVSTLRFLQILGNCLDNLAISFVFSGYFCPIFVFIVFRSRITWIWILVRLFWPIALSIRFEIHFGAFDTWRSPFCAHFCLNVQFLTVFSVFFLGSSFFQFWLFFLHKRRSSATWNSTSLQQ